MTKADVTVGQRIDRFSVDGGTVVVPDLAAEELTALTKREGNFKHIDDEYERWDYYRDIDGNPIAGRGMTFDALIYTPELGSVHTPLTDPEKHISSEKVRAFFGERGFIGHVGAFTRWLGRNPNLKGAYASIPEDKACFRRGPGGDLFLPYARLSKDIRELCRYFLTLGWSGSLFFVGFRPIL